jgi:hypothetical protein
MCSENEPDRHGRDAQDRAQEEIRRLFERYRAASRHEAAATREVGVQAPDTPEEPERALTSR